MKLVAVTSFLTLALLANAIGQASNPPDEPKAVKIYCPTVGLPGAKTECGCPGGYCSLRPQDKLTTDYQGGKVRFCCGECLKKFKEAPAKFAVTANHQLVATKQAKQTNCPLCGGKADPNVLVDVVGVKVACCSADCAKKVEDATKAERINLVFGEKAFARGFVVSVEKK